MKMGIFRRKRILVKLIDMLYDLITGEDGFLVTLKFT